MNADHREDNALYSRILSPIANLASPSQQFSTALIFALTDSWMGSALWASRQYLRHEEGAGRLAIEEPDWAERSASEDALDRSRRAVRWLRPPRDHGRACEPTATDSAGIANVHGPKPL